MFDAHDGGLLRAQAPLSKNYLAKILVLSPQSQQHKIKQIKREKKKNLLKVFG
jgi:hypothetical protein